MPIEAPFLKSVSVRGAPGRPEYPYNIPIVENGLDLAFTRPVTIICGENGTGKSTLIELIAAHCGFSITGGNRNHRSADEENDVAALLKYAKFS
jgi:predicted ATPase